MPTPEEVAHRLLAQHARGNAALPPQLQWMRERVRPAERAAALFVGSLWPGVGEAAVRVREEEERRRAEEEVAVGEDEEHLFRGDGRRRGKSHVADDGLFELFAASVLAVGVAVADPGTLTHLITEIGYELVFPSECSLGTYN